MSEVKIVLAAGMDQRAVDEARDRGYLNFIYVEVDGSRLYPVCFLDLSNLQWELGNLKQGHRYRAEPGMIVLQEITLEAMQEAAQALCDDGYFDYMVPFTRERIEEAARTNPNRWPPP